MRTKRLRLAAVALTMGLTLVAADLLSVAADTRWLGTTGVLGILFAVGAFVTVMSQVSEAGALRRGFGQRENAHVMQNAVDALETLRFTAEATATMKSSINATKAVFGLEDTDAITRKERESSRPQMIADLIDFIRRHLALVKVGEGVGDRRIAIAVDELDKMANVDK